MIEIEEIKIGDILVATGSFPNIGESLRPTFGNTFEAGQEFLVAALDGSSVPLGVKPVIDETPYDNNGELQCLWMNKVEMKLLEKLTEKEK